ncbi:hypothetical protein RHCRD62_30449 [Rhodococcus sp. RD6.2]|nr:hypothetical protein RHCRD62_30449 [Rhodococcus sp. RD6.2]
MFEGCSPEPAGGPLEVPGNGVPRWMVVARRLAPGTGSGLQTNSSAHTPPLSTDNCAPVRRRGHSCVCGAIRSG